MGAEWLMLVAKTGRCEAELVPTDMVAWALMKIGDVRSNDFSAPDTRERARTGPSFGGGRGVEGRQARSRRVSRRVLVRARSGSRVWLSSGRGSGAEPSPGWSRVLTVSCPSHGLVWSLQPFGNCCDAHCEASVGCALG